MPIRQEAKEAGGGNTQAGVIVGKGAPARAPIIFRLYVARGAPNSNQALENLQAFCRRHLPDPPEIEVIDIREETKRALRDGILVSPTLVKAAPLPVLKVVGNLSDPDKLFAAFRELMPAAAARPTPRGQE